LLEQLQHFLDRRLSFAPGKISAIGIAILEVQTDDLVVIFFDDRNGRLALGSRHVVTDVEIEADVVPYLHERVNGLDRRNVVGVVMESNPDLVLVSKRRESLG